MNKLNQDTYNTMINFGNTLNQSWPEKDGQTIRLLRLPSLLHTFIWSCVWDPCTFVRKKKKTTETGVHCVTWRHWESLNETKLFSPWWWQTQQQHSHFVAQKRQHTARWWQSWEHFRINYCHNPQYLRSSSLMNILNCSPFHARQKFSTGSLESVHVSTPCPSTYC